jgi:hypothetical protein
MAEGHVTVGWGSLRTRPWDAIVFEYYDTHRAMGVEIDYVRFTIFTAVKILMMFFSVKSPYVLVCFYQPIHTAF